MKTTDLFNFRFVDRNNEQHRFKRFFENSGGNILWIRGQRGLGKTTFVNFMMKEYPEYNLCYLNISPESDSVTIISEFVQQLQRHCEFSFIEETKNRYKEFYSSAYQTLKKITNVLFPQISDIIELVLDTGYYVVTKSDEKKESIDIIYHFIELILSKKKLCMCIDNLSRCNTDTIHFFLRVIKNFLQNDNFRACIVTTSEDLNSDIKSEILRCLPLVDIEIARFQKNNYFYEILEPIFNLSNFEQQDFEYIFTKCEGSPKKLSTVISKLLEKQGIALYKNSKAIINKSILFSILQTEHIKFKESDFTSPQKWIIFSFICIGEKISIEYLKDLAIYISGNLFLYYTYDTKIFNAELLKLIENRVLKYSDSDNLIDACHDEDYIELQDIFNESPISSMFSSRTFEFFSGHTEYSNAEKIICKNAMRANIPEWEKLNFRYGKKLFHKKQYQDAQQIFTRLSASFHKLHPIQILLVGINSYEAGYYALAIKQFICFPPETLKFKKLKFYYNYYLAKSYNNTGNVAMAVQILESILEEYPEEGQEYLRIINLLHMYYLEIPGKENAAKDIFEKIYQNYQELFPEIWANTMRGCQNFKKGKEALEILNQAEKILSDELEKAFLENTRGFILVKSNQLSEGEKCFQSAADSIARLKKHEYAYAANNWAVCRMLNDDFYTARNILSEALFWNRTVYGELVIQTHLMICSAYLGYSDDMQYYYETLKKYIEETHPSDYTINRKILMNLAVVDYRTGNYIMAEAYIRRAKQYVMNTSTEWLYRTLACESTYCPPQSNHIYQTKKFEPWFLIYAHD